VLISTGVVLALAIGAVLIGAWGVSPITAYGELIGGAFGNRNGVAETFIRAAPLALAGIGVALAFRTGVFNVGAEGQLYIGGIATAWSGLNVAGHRRSLGYR
jgi:ABC-type uncharacterized transport system permease subunit